MKIYFGTHNMGKLKEFREILSGVAELEHIDAEVDERRSDDPLDIVRDKAKRLSEKFNKPMVCDDSGLFIKSLKDFPGTCSAYIHKRIGLKGILQLMGGISDREAEYRCAVGYCEPGKDAVSFLGVEKGVISDSIRGDGGFGHDPIFIPEGSNETYAEMDNNETAKKFRREAVLKLVEYLKNK